MKTALKRNTKLSEQLVFLIIVGFILGWILIGYLVVIVMDRKSGNTVARLTYLGDGKWWSWESVRYVVTHWIPLPTVPESEV